MSFENDVFISYAHIDDEPLAKGQNGWIELLEQRLRIRLAQLLGEPAKVWRDPKLQGNDEFSSILLNRISKVALLVSILSPRYLKSEWCLKELDEFCRQAALQGGLSLNDKSRVFKVVKTFIPRQHHPGQLQGLLGYEFFEYDEVSERAREFSPEIDPNRDPRYWEKLEDLAWDIKRLIEKLREPPDRSGPPDSPRDTGSKGDEGSSSDGSAVTAIYLAETTSDLSESRDKIRRELEQYGHLVLPDKALPLDASSLQEAVRGYLENSRLSIHLIGENYGIIPEMEPERSVVRMQEELAMERGDNAEFSRLIWMPPGLEPKDVRQQKFVMDLQNSFSSHNGSELLQIKLEDLKTIIQAKIMKKPKTCQALQAPGGTRIYLICDQQDVDAAELLRSYLLDQGYEATVSLSEGSGSEVFEDHKENLLICDAVLIFQGNASEGWLRMKLRELLKLPGYGRTTPLLGKAIYMGGPESQAKERFRTFEAQVIKNYHEFDPASLDPFIAQISIAQISQAKGGSQ
jgi:hypothetical protein